MEQLGIQPIQLLTQTINFVIVVVLLTKFFYRPITKMLEERQKRIEEGLRYSEKMKKEMEKTQAKSQAILAAAKAEGQEIIAEAKKMAKKAEADILKEAQKEVEATRERTKVDMAMERQELMRTVKAQSIELATEIAGKLLADVLTDATQKKIIDKKISAIKHTSLAKS